MFSRSRVGVFRILGAILALVTAIVALAPTSSVVAQSSPASTGPSPVARTGSPTPATRVSSSVAPPASAAPNPTPTTSTIPFPAAVCANPPANAAHLPGPAGRTTDTQLCPTAWPAPVQVGAFSPGPALATELSLIDSTAAATKTHRYRAAPAGGYTVNVFPKARTAAAVLLSHMASGVSLGFELNGTATSCFPGRCRNGAGWRHHGSLD
jgi:hypothetical protein